MAQTKEEIGRRIRHHRKARGLTVKDLAGAVEMSAGYLSEVERGMSAVSGELLARIAAALRVTAGALLEGEGEILDRKTVEIPATLSEAAKAEGWTYRTTLLLLQGKLSLTARRANQEDQDWQATDWIRFHNQVKDFINE